MISFDHNMAVSIARKIAAVLFAVAMVGSVAVGPALADDDVDVGGDGVSVGGDDGVTVGAGDDGSTNGSTTISASADQDGVDADAEVSGGDGSGTDGSLDCEVSSDTQDPSEACETSGGDTGTPSLPAPDAGDAPETPEMPGAGDAPEAPSLSDGGNGGSGGSSAPPTTMEELSTPDESVEAPTLPVNYTEDVPFEAFPDFCNPPYGIDDAREANPVDPTDPVPGAVKDQAPEGVPTEPPQTPVGDPLGLVSAPVSQCDVFNPYDPAVNPTSPPDDPSATLDRRSTSVGQNGVYLNWLAEGTTGQDAPGGDTMAVVMASQEMSAVILDAYGTNGRTETGGEVDVRLRNNRPNNASYAVSGSVVGQGASASLECDGSECKPEAGGVPSGGSIPAFPAGGGSDNSQSPQPDPSAETDQPTANAGPGGAVIIDDRRATLGDGLPAGEHDAVLATDGQRAVAREDAQASGGGHQGNLETDYDSGQYPGDDDIYVLAKGDGAGVVVGLNCDDYRCTPADNTGVYPGPASMVFDMIPDAPAP